MTTTAQPKAQTALEGRALATLKILLKPLNVFHVMTGNTICSSVSNFLTCGVPWMVFILHHKKFSVLSSFPQISRILVWTQSHSDQPFHIPIVPRAFWKHSAHYNDS